MSTLHSQPVTKKLNIYFFEISYFPCSNCIHMKLVPSLDMFGFDKYNEELQWFVPTIKCSAAENGTQPLIDEPE